MRKLLDIQRLLRDKDYTTKIKLYFSIKGVSEDYDPEYNNYTYSNLNPITIKGYVSQLSPTSLVWREYGLKSEGSVEVLCEKRYKNWFEKANKIVIDDEEYEIFREAVGGRVIITSRPFNLIKIILNRKT